ncbi:MAG: hypothetical protein BWX86_02455 [Verrucomicrobia bacterium ADurb.Bin122]|nr:MAG: hypothetical protein BWX86_02455 [Verrucomicrobia bacterium ADurb.Bin122]
MDAGAALGTAEVVPAVFLEKVRPLDPDRLLAQVDAAVDDDRARADELAFRDVELLNPDGAVALVERLVVGRIAVVDHPRAAVVVEEQRRIDAVEGQPLRVGPRAGGIGGGDEEITAAVDVRTDDVEGAVVVLDRGCEKTAGGAHPGEIKLGRTVDHVANLGPVDEVAAVEDRDAGKIGEGGIDEVIILAHAADGGIGIEAGEDGIAELTLRQRSGEEIVAARVLEPVEADGAGGGGEGAGGTCDQQGGEETFHWD